MIRKYFKLAIIILISLPMASSVAQTSNFARKTFESNGYNEACFVLYDIESNTMDVFNPSLANKRVSPASTFKIFNSLISLENGVLEGSDHILKWDGIQRRIPSWNRDHNLRSAFQNSVTWYYMECARRNGKEYFAQKLKECDYGDMKTEGNVNDFWLTGGFNVSAVDQVVFLSKLANYQLPFDSSTVNTLKDIMVFKDDQGTTLYAKTGTSQIIDGRATYWWVGWVETMGRKYAFSTMIRTPEYNPKIYRDRINLTLEVLKEQGIITEQFAAEAAPEPTIEKSLEMMVGQMIMVGMKGSSLDKNKKLVEAIQLGTIGGVILFEKNVPSKQSAEKLTSLNAQMQDYSKIPLFIAIDQEGGHVNRLKAKYGFPDSKRATYLGSIDNEDSTRHYANLTAVTLDQLGFNINFAPVVDLCSNPDNPIIAGYGRCYSDNPDVVTKHAQWVIDEHHRQGVLTTIKHFPGHGSSTKDSHKGLTDVTKTWKQNEVKPYVDLINAHQVDAIMTAHIVNCNLDSNCIPSTLSPVVINNMLRDSLNYQGLIFTDDMQMHAITKYYGLEKSIEMAINAGVDIVLFSNNIKGSGKHQANVVHEIIIKLVNEGKISRERIEESYQRIIKAKMALYPEFYFPE